MKKEDALKMVKENGIDIKNLSEELKNDKDIIEAALSNDGMSMFFLSLENRNKKEYALMAVKQDGKALIYLNKELQEDINVVTAALSNYGVGYSHLNQEMRRDKNLLIIALKTHPFAFESASEELLYDKDVLYQVSESLTDFANKEGMGENFFKESFIEYYERLVKYQREDDLQEILGNKKSGLNNKKNKI